MTFNKWRLNGHPSLVQTSDRNYFNFTIDKVKKKELTSGLIFSLLMELCDYSSWAPTSSCSLRTLCYISRLILGWHSFLYNSVTLWLARGKFWSQSMFSTSPLLSLTFSVLHLLPVTLVSALLLQLAGPCCFLIPNTHWSLGEKQQQQQCVLCIIQFVKSPKIICLLSLLFHGGRKWMGFRHW